MTFRLPCCDPTFWAGVWHHSRFCKARDEHGLKLALQKVSARLLKGDELDEAARLEFDGSPVALIPACADCLKAPGLCELHALEGERRWDQELDRRQAL